MHRVRSHCVQRSRILPVAEIRLQKIVLDACTSIFQDVHGYSHTQIPDRGNRLTEHLLAQLSTETKAAGLAFKFVVTAAILQHAAPVALTPPSQALTPEYAIPGFSSKGRPWGTHDRARLSRKNRLLLRGPGATWEQVLADEEAIARREEDARKDVGAPAEVQGGAAALRPDKAGATEAVARTGRFFGLKASWDREDGDGVWDCTWEGGLEKGFDVVICVLYFEV